MSQEAGCLPAPFDHVWNISVQQAARPFTLWFASIKSKILPSSSNSNKTPKYFHWLELSRKPSTGEIIATSANQILPAKFLGGTKMLYYIHQTLVFSWSVDGDKTSTWTARPNYLWPTVCKFPIPYSNFDCCNILSSRWQRHPRDSQLRTNTKPGVQQMNLLQWWTRKFIYTKFKCSTKQKSIVPFPCPVNCTTY